MAKTLSLAIIPVVLLVFTLFWFSRDQGNQIERKQPERTTGQTHNKTMADRPTKIVSKDKAKTATRKEDKPADGDLKRIPLILAQVHIPDMSDTGSHGTAAERLDIATEYESGDAVAAALAGAKLAGWAAGYEFTPVCDLKVEEKPRDAIRKLASDADVALLLRVSTRTPNFGGPTMIWVMADAALYRTSDLTVLLSAGFVEMDKLDEKHISGNKIKGEYWLETATRLFAKEFDPQVLAKMQHIMQKQEIVNGIAKLKQSANLMALEPSISPLEGGEERSPELAIAAGEAGRSGVAYLEQKGTGNIRKWLLGSAQEVDVNIEPGVYIILIETRSDKGASQAQVYRSEVKIDYKKRYSYRV